MRICGVDEAGKGSVLGPMVTAGVLAEDEDAGILAGCGAKDSKQLTPQKRERLYEEIVSRWKTCAVIRTPAQIDARESTMNQFTAACHAEVIRTLLPETAYVDACDVNADRFADTVLRLSGVSVRMVSEHKADGRYPIVGAASIVAKVTRDRLIEELAEEFGSVGSGYPSDAATVSFLTEYIREHKTPPSCARRSWQTVDDIIAKCSQQSLSAFF